MKLRVGDTVQVIAGSDKGKTGEIIQILRKEDRVIVEGVNMVTKHIKPSQADPEGGIQKQNKLLKLVMLLMKMVKNTVLIKKQVKP